MHGFLRTSRLRKRVCPQIIQLLLISTFLLFGSGVVWAQVAPAANSKGAAKKSPQNTQLAQNETSGAPQAPASVQTAAPVQEEDTDDPDMPSMLGNKMDRQTYLRLRAEYIGRLRGIDPKSPPDLRIRINAIRSMEQQEQRIYGNRSDSAAPQAGTIAPF